MNLKWKKYQGTHYCYDEEYGRIVGEMYENVLTGHVTAWIDSLSEPKEKFGTWLTVKDGKAALENEIEYRDRYNL